MNWRTLLFPFSFLYGTGVWLRNRAFDSGIKKSATFDLPVICVGNLEAGGAGKTPMTEYLVRLLKNDHKISTLSRGYGRKTKGFLKVVANADASQTGDEPAQLKAKFPEVNVTVDEDRVHGINQIKEASDVIILDDAFQHRAVTAGLNILLFDHQSLQRPKLLLPAGNWRDLFSERKRADMLIVTKCPAGLSKAEKLQMQKHLQTRPDQPVFFSTLFYGNLMPLFDSELKTPDSQLTTAYLLTGIANPQPLASFIAQNFGAVHHHRYPDHHAFTKQNITKLVDDFRRGGEAGKIIITTEKDARRLMRPELRDLLQQLPVFVQPVQMQFLDERGTEFDLLIGNYVSRDTSHS